MIHHVVDHVCSIRVQPIALHLTLAEYENIMMNMYRLPYFSVTMDRTYTMLRVRVEKDHDHFVPELAQATSRNKNQQR
uniref:Uncharacterized protein n=1 Tax=Arundo donax TaxID=35708 RepID=A0A0A9DLJ6_ARUDO